MTVLLVKLGENVPALTVSELNVALAAIAEEDDRAKINTVTKNSNRLIIINFVSARALSCVR